MKQPIKQIIIVLSIYLAGCGVESAGTAATVATMKAKETQQAQENKEQVVKQLDDMQKQVDQRMKGAEEK
jgi:hypothetical protein